MKHADLVKEVSALTARYSKSSITHKAAMELSSYLSSGVVIVEQGLDDLGMDETLRNLVYLTAMQGLLKAKYIQLGKVSQNHRLVLEALQLSLIIGDNEDLQEVLKDATDGR